MSANSEVWTMAGNVATTQNLLGITLARIAAKAIMGRFPSAEALLDACSKDLNGVKERFDEITKTIAGDPSRGELISAAVERQQCKSLETLDFSLRSLLDERNDLSLRSQKSSLWDRNSPFSKFREEISELKEATGSLLSDTRNTTSARLARGRSDPPRSDPALLPTPPRSDMSTPTIARQQPDEYSLGSLDTMRHALDYISRMDQGAEAAELPV
ncbi:hypothetical protein EDB83DRAFT_2355442 [Lactarius deliciosus]|nr:hypothetical protein EDB83DRAFT_2355438 [Lactarius deliciosus]KAH9074212.1 hypothetical protein EDB83DRAFT_2355442 [Lactarius deliciosus]